MEELQSLLSFQWFGTNGSPGVRPHVLPIEGYGDYLIRGDGVVFTMKGGEAKELKPWISKHGYALVDLSVNKKITHKSVHRLVALAFIPNPDNKPEVNHKDGDKLNNSATNLEWSTKSENIAHSFGVLGNKHPRAKRVRCVETGVVYKSASEAARKHSTNVSNISAVIKGRRKLAGGYGWEFYDG